jgi:hypothetical protein
MQQFILGATMMGYVTVALFFLRFWTRTRDPLFACFSVSFALLAVERWFALPLSVADEPHSYIYAFRLLAFLIIIGGIANKNRK